MSNVTLRRAVAADFPEIYRSLLVDFHNPYLTEADYRRLFEANTGEDWHGYVLEHEGSLVGFASLLFSTRMIRGQSHRFANFNHWIVKEGFRNSHSLSLVFAAMKLKDITLTAYTPIAKVVPIYQTLRWQELDRYTHIIPFLPDPRALDTSPLVFSRSQIESRLSPTERTLFADHQYPHCRHLYIEDPAGGCYVVYTRVRRKNLPFAAIHYIGNLPVFLRRLPLLRCRICLRERTVALLIDDRFLCGNQLFASFKYEEPRFFKSSNLTKFEIDALYSEYTVVNV